VGWADPAGCRVAGLQQRGNDVHRFRGLAIAVTVTIALGASAVGASAQAAGPGGATQATEVGITSSTIRIGVIADDNDALAPGLFAGSPRAVTAYAKLINATAVSPAESSKLTSWDPSFPTPADGQRRHQGLQPGLAIVVPRRNSCKTFSNLVAAPTDGRGNGLPDIAGFSANFAEGCSPVTFSPNPVQIDWRHL